MDTHVFTLPSGVECEVKDLTGKHQRILTEQKSKKLGENLNEVLADVIVRVGNCRVIDLPFIESMLAADRKKALTEVRAFTFDHEPMFNFKFEYLAEENGVEMKKEKEMEVKLSRDEEKDGETITVDGFPVKPYKQQWKEYSEIQKEVTLTLPKSGKEIIYKMLDGHGERAGMSTKKNERSSHTALIMRHPREYIKTASGKTPIVLDLDSLPLKDIEALRSSIKENEGQVDTEFRFEHPDADNKSPGEKEVVIDILSVLAFFFPSEAI